MSLSEQPLRCSGIIFLLRLLSLRCSADSNLRARGESWREVWLLRSDHINTDQYWSKCGDERLPTVLMDAALIDEATALQ